MSESRTYLEATARAMHGYFGEAAPLGVQVAGRIYPDSGWKAFAGQARAALTAIGMTEAQMQAPVGSIVLLEAHELPPRALVYAAVRDLNAGACPVACHLATIYPHCPGPDVDGDPRNVPYVDSMMEKLRAARPGSEGSP